MSEETKEVKINVPEGYEIDTEKSTFTNIVFKKKCLSRLENQAKPQIRTGVEWVNTIDDACDKRYSEEYAEGEYCHEQSFKWGFQEGVDWLEKQVINKGYPIDANGIFPTYEDIYNIIREGFEKQYKEKYPDLIKAEQTLAKHIID